MLLLSLELDLHPSSRGRLPFAVSSLYPCLSCVRTAGGLHANPAGKATRDLKPRRWEILRGEGVCVSIRGKGWEDGRTEKKAKGKSRKEILLEWAGPTADRMGAYAGEESEARPWKLPRSLLLACKNK